ncbi:osmoprotectant NAGGN system M42 family peptidase [Geoalkalibacter halelectricus]|uniref:Osmoprotectant NAGGN system M42 family peptidase n=1 Tax=Geoalkalibacter halelectricus TaxID=2847045 RepID=A0ABY5ZKX4_9BACT|nr:osmoprotectant NAGGN system M42 family peptidase [Geoalkalibacter halelectricus]MDO3378881.1 osmoprotectant NAGGN system M42 family peptidase [Geoalkalibacter halelectricus]UWZ79817.1 osmoprotectant NAGGN system M42 family peptidase [Geoalkalibacter halelectricus]
MQRLSIDLDYLSKQLVHLLNIASPTGYTDQIVHYVGEELERLGIPFELTRRGAIRADLTGRQRSPDRALVVHLDTTGAMVKTLKDNGRLEIVPIGHWSSRFAEGARVSIFTDKGCFRGTVLPLKASGHTFNEEVDTQPVAWNQVEVRVDAVCNNRQDLARQGFNVGDYLAFDAAPELVNGFVNARHLDNKAGVATLLAAAAAVARAGVELPVDCHLLFTISEETGSGASAVLHRDVAEMVSIDNATPAPGQNSRESGVTVAMMDSSGPFDYHLTHKLLGLCREFEILHQRDVFRYYRCDSASAVEAGNDIRTALVCFGVDASHGYERTHLNALRSLAELISLYMQSDPTFLRDRDELGALRGFPHQGDTLERR